MDWNEIEAKWQRLWDENRIFEADVVLGKPKFFVIFAYPGISGYLHVGHLRSYTYPDIIARYKRMKGFNVLFPAGFHASGLPSVGFAKKIENNDVNTIQYLKHHGVSDEELEKLKDPYFVVEFFGKEYEKVWRHLGYSIDWRRNISTIKPDYNKFMEWQFHKLNENNLIVKKPHYAPYCPNCGPVAVDTSETDISKGGNASVLEFTVIKFKFNDYVLPCATLRPETVFGVTNVWVNPDVESVVSEVGSGKWILSKEAFEKLRYQRNDVKLTAETIKGSDIVGKTCVSPLINREVPILPASFVLSSVGTGIVMSVPGHAPYDWIALLDIKKSDESLSNITPVSIIKTKDFGEFSSRDVIAELSISGQDDSEKLEKATDIVYKKEFHTGVMKDNCWEVSGMPVSKAKEVVKEKLISQNDGINLYEFSEDVVCRCGAKVVIKLIPDQWFIKYSDSKVKENSHKCADLMKIFPEEYKANIHNIIDWYNDRACSRQGRWLGTRLPFDNNWIIEPISDSTLYPAMYVISLYSNGGMLSPDLLTPEFFDYVFLGKGNPDEISDKLNVNPEILKNLRGDFEYWYPLDMNFGGKEHQSVHFPVFIFNHVAVFSEKNWPRGIFVNWWVLGKGGNKISKSKGGADPIPDVVSKYTADGIRLYYAHAGNQHMDIEWDPALAVKYKRRMSQIVQLAGEMLNISSDEEKPIDNWIISRLNHRINNVTNLMDDYKLRDASIEIFYETYSDINWWLRRGGSNKEVALQILGCWVKMISPFTPHLAEELYEKIPGSSGFVSLANYPEFDKNSINRKAEIEEDMLKELIDNLRNILELTKKTPGKIHLYLAPEWMRGLYNAISCDMKMSELMKNPDMRAHGAEIAGIMKKTFKSNIPEVVLTLEEEYGALTDAKEFIEQEFGCGFEIQKEVTYDPEKKSVYQKTYEAGNFHRVIIKLKFIMS